MLADALNLTNISKDTVVHSISMCRLIVFHENGVKFNLIKKTAVETYDHRARRELGCSL